MKIEQKPVSRWRYYFYSISCLVLFACSLAVTLTVIFKPGQLHLSSGMQRSLLWLPVLLLIPISDFYITYREVNRRFASVPDGPMILHVVRYHLFGLAFHCYVAILGIVSLLLAALYSMRS
jgi:hypothetical protein